MPARFFTGQCEVYFAAIASIVAAAGGIDNLASPAIWDKSQLRIFCFLGAMGGAFLSIVIFPPRPQIGNYARRLAGKFFASVISGMMFAPIVIRWRGWPLDVDIVLAVSGAMGVASVSLITKLVPVFVKRARRLAGEGDDEKSPEN